MTWLTWRLHRTEAAIGVLLFAGLIAIMLVATQRVNSAYDTAQDGGCFGTSQDDLCPQHLTDFFGLSSRWHNLTTLLHGVPLAAAGLLMIPTLQELERGTHRLSWIQSITRRRWSLSRIGFVAGFALLVAVIWAVTAREWRSSILRVAEPSFNRDSFDLSPVVLIGYSLFAVALALAAAVVVRRLVPALALTAVGFIGTRILITFVVRPRYRPAIEDTVAPDSANGPYTGFADLWVLDESWITNTGERLSWARVDQLCPTGAIERTYRQCLIDNGLSNLRTYHPTSRVEQFQFIEAALYLGLAAGLLALTYWWLTRRGA